MGTTRRTVIATISTAVVGSIAGCGGGGTTVGDEVTEGDLTASVRSTTTVDEIDGNVSGSNHAASESTTLLLTELFVENTGDQRRTPPWPRSGLVAMDYNDDERDTLYLSGQFQAGGQSYTSWNEALVTATEDERLYPGKSATGWEAFELEAGYDPADVTILIGLDTGDNEPTVVEFTLE